jgi:RAD3-like DEAD/DEAH box helicase
MTAKSNAKLFLPEDPPTAEKLRDLLHRLHGFQPRPDQVEAIKTLTIDQRDLILIARTGWGKSMIFQSVPALRRGGIALLIMPLNLLEEDQVGKTAGVQNDYHAPYPIGAITDSSCNLTCHRLRPSRKYLAVFHVFSTVNRTTLECASR